MMKPWENISYFGNQKIISQLDTLYENDKLNSTLLFNGSYGLGKATLAFRFSNYILNQKTEKFTSFTIKNNTITNKIKKNVHPDLIYISNNDQDNSNHEIKIDQIRTLKTKLISKTLNGTNRIVIIDPLESLNKSSFNSLLKVLEEPPQKTLFILICHQINKIPDTILSRSIKFNFNNIDIDDTKKILELNKIQVNTDKIINLYDNNRVTAGKIIHLLENSLEEIVDDFENFVSKQQSDDYKNILKRVKKYIKKEDNDKFLILIELFMIWIKKNAIQMLHNIEDNSNLLRRINLWKKYHIKYKNLIEFNLNKEEFILTLHKDIQILLKEGK